MARALVYGNPALDFDREYMIMQLGSKCSEGTPQLCNGCFSTARTAPQKT